MKCTDVFVVYRDGFPVVTGTASECAKVLGVNERTVRWYSTPCCVKRESEGRYNVMAVRIEEGGADG